MRAIWIGLPAMLLMGITALAQGTATPNPPACADFARPGADIHGCDAGIAAETDPKAKSVLLLRRAYMRDQVSDHDVFRSAKDDLDQAIALWPDNWGAWHERGYIENEIGDTAQAASDLDHEAALNPDAPLLHSERALARFRLGDLAGAFQDRDRDVALHPDDASARAARAEALMWLGRFEEAKSDLDQAQKLATAGGDTDTLTWVTRLREDIARWTNWGDPSQAAAACANVKDETAFQDAHFIGNCTRAFLDARSGSDKAEALTGRGLAIELSRQNPALALDDFRLAAALDPSNPDLEGNLGGLLANIGRLHEALRHLDAAIAVKPNAYAYAARASVKYELNDFKGAFADAKTSFGMGPNQANLTVLGDLAFTQLKDTKAAKSYWMGAYHLGDRDDGLIERLKKVGVENPDAEPSTP